MGHDNLSAVVDKSPVNITFRQLKVVIRPFEVLRQVDDGVRKVSHGWW
jgi:hypothetical protein